MVLELVAFALLAALIIGSAVLVVAAREIVHSALGLVVTFASIGGLFLLLNSEFVALIQILVYAGAVTILMLFAIMLTKRTILQREEGGMDASPPPEQGEERGD